MNKSVITIAGLFCIFLVACANPKVNQVQNTKMAVDYVNPYMGTISHLLVPTFPTMHLPNSMLRVIPSRRDYTTDRLNGLPVVITSHIPVILQTYGGTGKC